MTKTRLLLTLCLPLLLTSCFKDEVSAVASISLDEQNITLFKGETQTLRVSYTPENACGRSCRWSSDDESVATVSAEGGITAVKSGAATISATSTDGKSAACVVTVQDFPDLLRIVQSGIFYAYDSGDSYNAPWLEMQDIQHNMYSGYFHSPFAFQYDKNTVYNLNTAWSNVAWDITYQYIFPAVCEAEAKSRDANDLRHYHGIAKILKVELMHRISDTYGPIVYNKTGSGEADSQKDAYTAFFKDLDEGIKALDDFLKGNGDNTAFDAADMLNRKDGIKGWIRFANSLRLRLAMRVSNVDKTSAAREVKKALSNPYGVIEDADETVQVSGHGYLNPLYQAARAGMIRMGASMASVLNGYQDPRLPAWFSNASLSGHTNEYLGIPQGVFAQQNAPNHYEKYSSFNYATGDATPAILMTAAEVWQLRAEAALRGYTGENIQACYERGIEISFEQWNAGDATAYLAEDSRTPSPYTEYVPASGGRDMPALIRITSKWDNSASNEEKLEKIITQKWLACFPESYEAWAEQRRTGYPKLFKVQTNKSGGTIGTEEMIRRLPFSTVDAAEHPDRYTRLKAALEGADNGGTRLWWDAGGNVF